MTEYLKVDQQQPDPETLRKAAKALLEGGLVAFPTETVYGLGAAAPIPEAVERLRFVKNRPENKPFSYLLADGGIAGELVDEIPSRAQALMNRYWPGPLTLVLPRGPGSQETVGIRVPADPVALELLRLTEALVLAPSANPSGRPPATTAEEVRDYFDGKIDMVVDAGEVTLKEPSTVVRFDQRGCEVLRAGIISAAMVHQLVSGKTILFVCSGNTCRSPMAEAFFRKYLARKLAKPAEDLGELGFRIASAGTFAQHGSRASPGAGDVMKERGSDLSSHVSQPVRAELVREADRIYVMTNYQLEVVTRIDPSSASRAQLLSDREISDPIGGDLKVYRACADEIETAVKRIVESF